MGEFSHLEVGGRAAIDLPDDSLRRWIAHVIEPGFDGHFGGGFGEITEAKEIGICGRINPDRRFQFGGDAGGLRRIEAGAGELENAAKLEVIAHDLSEKGSVRFRSIGARREVRDGQAGLVGIHADRGAKPILRRRRSPAESENHQDQEGTKASALYLHPHLPENGKTPRTRTHVLNVWTGD